MHLSNDQTDARSFVRPTADAPTALIRRSDRQVSTVNVPVFASATAIDLTEEPERWDGLS
jgi:hypothetical protein